MRATDLVGGPFTPPGFYYKTFMRPRKLWPLYEKFLRNAAGLGKLRHAQPEREWRTEYRRRHADVLVTGGGLAGLHAAHRRRRPRRRRRAGRRGPRAGRPAARRRRPGRDRRAGGAGARRPGWRSSTTAPRSATSTASCRSGRTTRCTRFARRAHVFATGAIEQPLVFAGNDLPGVMLVRRRPPAGRALRGQPRSPRGRRHHLATAACDAAVALRGAGVADRRRSPTCGPSPASSPARCAPTGCRCSPATR